MTNEEIVKAIQAGNIELTAQLWEQCCPYIRKQAKRWKQAWNNRIDVDVDDLVQVGYFALCSAIRGWDANKGSSFLNYIDYYLKTEFSKACNCRTGTDKADPIYSALRFESPVFGDLDGLTIADTMGGACSALEEIEEKDFQEYIVKTVREAVEKLPPIYRKAVEAHYLVGVPYTTVAENMGVSVSRAQQLGTRGLRKIRENKESEELRKLYYEERNFYRGTGFLSWRDTGISSPEREVLHLENVLNLVQQ